VLALATHKVVEDGVQLPLDHALVLRVKIH
jgi:hypothetical protein